jgi:hypothetical protein
MPKNQYTHIGIIRGQDSRTPSGYKVKCSLRETRNFWITTNGTKYRKADGQGTGDWPMTMLDLDTIKPKE